jgi:hypothetical protein
MPGLGLGMRSPRVNIPRSRRSPPLAPNNLMTRKNVRVGKSLTAKPEVFNGEKNKFVQWWRTVILYIAGFEEEPSDMQKILMVLSYLKGQNAAGQWADLYVMQGLDATKSFDDFQAKLAKIFQPTDLKRTAEKKRLALKQGKEIVEDFMTRRKQLVLKAEYNIFHHLRLLINIMRNGLHNGVVEYIERSQPDLLDSTNFDRWEKSLTRVGQIL